MRESLGRRGRTDDVSELCVSYQTKLLEGEAERILFNAEGGALEGGVGVAVVCERRGLDPLAPDGLPRGEDARKGALAEEHQRGLGHEGLQVGGAGGRRPALLEVGLRGDEILHERELAAGLGEVAHELADVGEGDRVGVDPEDKVVRVAEQLDVELVLRGVPVREVLAELANVDAAARLERATE